MSLSSLGDSLASSGKNETHLFSPFSNISKLWSHKFLIRNLVQREVRGKYRNAMLGYAWSVIEPTLLSVVYWFLFIMLAGNPDEHYAVWVLIGVIVWGCFGKSLMSSVTSLTGNTRVIHLVYFPRIIFPTTAMFSTIVTTLMSSIVVIPIIIAYGFPVGPQLILIPLGIFTAGFMGMAFGLIFAPLNCLFRDVEHLFKFIVRAGFFVSPVMWTYEMAIERGVYGEMVLWNPMVAPITIARHGLEGKWADMPSMWLNYTFSITILFWMVGNIVFSKYERSAVKYL